MMRKGHNEHESPKLAARHPPLKDPIPIAPLNVSCDEERPQQDALVPGDSSSPPTPNKKNGKSRGEFAILKKLVLLLCNIFAWYYTNGMNGIAMQSFAARVRENNGDAEQQLNLGSNIAIITVTTALQLGIGALIGWGITFAMEFAQIWRPHSRTWSISRDTVLLGGLHSIGSVATNLGFMYGKASVIQIIKLLEPFETLFLSQLLIPEEGKWNMGIVSSVIFVICAAVSLLHIRPNKPHPYSVLFAVLSGLTLSLRNVLQRKQYAQIQQGDKSEEHTATKVQKTIMSFTKLSLDSFIMTTVLSFVVNGVLFVFSADHRATLTSAIFEGFHGEMFAWHPLYNTFSMITLGFCSAVTHSLLNAGKRVSAIVMAIIWFHEEVTSGTVMGLVAVAVGGCWYTIESRSRKKTTDKMLGVFKFVGSVLAVRALFEYQSLTSIAKTIKAS